MAQNWHDLLFAHWPVPAAVLSRLVPKNVQLDKYHDQAWIGVVPFRMSGVRLRGTPPFPWLSAFPELNVRTYVTAGGKPGVWFFSLDAANRLAVEVARLTFHLPYFHARMSAQTGAAGTIYSSMRKDRRGGKEEFEASYSAVGPVFETKAGTLEHFLTERYCLYAQRPDGALVRGEIHHVPWQLQSAEARFAVNTMTENLGIQIVGPALLHFAKLQRMIAWMPHTVAV